LLNELAIVVDKVQDLRAEPTIDLGQSTCCFSRL